MAQNNNYEKKVDTTTLTDYDLIELYIRCHERLFDVASRLDIESQRSFELAKVLWEKAIKARDDYRKGYSK